MKPTTNNLNGAGGDGNCRNGQLGAGGGPTNNLEGWEERFNEKFPTGDFGFGTQKVFINIKQFISELRQADCQALIKILPEKYIPLPNDDKDKMFCHVRNICFEDCKQLIKEYYEK